MYGLSEEDFLLQTEIEQPISEEAKQPSLLRL
jgi:hypothetical protein